MSILTIIFLLDFALAAPYIIVYVFRKVHKKRAFEKSLQAQIDAERKLIQETMLDSENIQSSALKNRVAFGKCLYCGALVKNGKCTSCGANSVTEKDLQNTEVLKALEYRHLEKIQELENMKYRAKLDQQKQTKDSALIAICVIAGLIILGFIAYFKIIN